MLQHPQFDPVALQLGPLAVHWYGLTYLAAFGLFWWLGTRRVALPHFAARGWTWRDVEDLLFWGVVGVVVGGRVGYALFYKPGQYLADRPALRGAVLVTLLPLPAGGAVLAAMAGGRACGVSSCGAWICGGVRVVTPAGLPGAGASGEWPAGALALAALASSGALLSMAPRLSEALSLLSFWMMRPELIGVLAGVGGVAGVLKLSMMGIAASAIRTRPLAIAIRFLIWGDSPPSPSGGRCCGVGFISVYILCSKRW